MQQSGGAERFRHAGKGVAEMWGALGQGCPPPTCVGGSARSPAECGVFIYYLWCVGALPGTRRGAGGSRGTVLVGGDDTEGPARNSPTCPGFVCGQNGAAGKATMVAGGCGSRDGAGWGWRPWDHVHVPSGGGTQGCPGGGSCISAGEDPTLSPGFSSPPHAAVQPFGSISPSLAHWGWERRRGGVLAPRLPQGQARDALSLLLPFNKLVFL